MAGIARFAVLLVGTEYSTFKGGISTINHEVARVFAAAGTVVYCTVLEATEQDERDAERDGVRLLKPRLDAGSSGKPSLEWLTVYHKHHFPHIPSDVGCIVGHVDVTGTAARKIKEERFPHAKLAMFGHVAPEETEHYKSDEKALGVGRKEASIQEDIGKADIVFSVGARIHRHYDRFLRRNRVNHYIFLPEPSKVFREANVSFDAESENVRKPERSVLSIGRVQNVEGLKGHDLATGAMDKVAQCLDGQYTLRLRVRGIDENDFKESKRILEEKLRSGRVKPTLLPYGTQEDIRRDMENCHLVLMPSRAEPFGLVGLEAIAAGVPVLISEHSGLAELIEELSEKLEQPTLRHCIVKMKGDTATDGDAERWAERIEDVLKNARSEFAEARAFKEKLLASEYWEESHRKLLQACGVTAPNSSDVPLEIRLGRPEMAKLYTEACRQGSLAVHSTRVPVVGQYRAGKTCFINRLMGEPVRLDEPITDGIQITADVLTKAWKKPQEELDEFDTGMAVMLLQETEPSAGEKRYALETTETLLQAAQDKSFDLSARFAVLLVGTEYSTFKGGISTINHEVARVFAAAGTVVYCTVLEATEQDERDAERDGVRLLKPRLDAGSSGKPSLEWLTVYHKHHFPHIPSDVGCIVGHVDVTGTAARKIKEERFPHAKLAMFGHVAPEETEHYKSDEKALGVGRKEASIQEDIGKADIVFSVGARIHRHYDRFLRQRNVAHYIFLPEPSKVFREATVSFRAEYGVRKPKRSVLSIGRVRNVEGLKGHDLAAGAMDKVAKRLDGQYTLRLRVRGIDENDFKESKRILEEKLRSGRVKPTLLPYGTQEDIRRDMENCHLVLMPSRAEPFGLVGLEAIAAGVPVLISEHSGLAELIEELSEKLEQPTFRHCIVKMKGDTATDGDAERWAERIEDVLKNARSEFEEARAFREKLLASKYWEESHRKLLQACGISDDPVETTETVLLEAAEEKYREAAKKMAQSTQTENVEERTQSKGIDLPLTHERLNEEKHTEVPGNVKEKMRNPKLTAEEFGTADHPRLSFWDFGGQATYYGTHHCFITYRGVYILVMSLLQKLSDDVPKLDIMASVDNLRTGGDYLDHWLNTVYSHTQQHSRRPPVIVVLTHKDKVSKEDIEKYKDEIRSHIEGKAAGRLVMPEIFAVDNTTEDAAVEEIREYIRQVARDLPHMGEEIPIPWLHLNSKLKTKSEKRDLFCKFQEIADLARDGPDINITDKHTLAMVLTFLHDRGDIIFFDEPSLRDDVTLQPQVMIDAFKTIITVPQYQQGRQTAARNMWETLKQAGNTLLTWIWKMMGAQTGQDLSTMWERLEQEGILSDTMLTRIWEEKDRQLEKPYLIEYKSFLKALMEKFYLICNVTPISDASDETQQEEIFFVPALLSCERDNAKLYPGNMRRCPQALYFEFSEKFLPSGMFCRLQALCVRRFGLQKSFVFAGCARFPTDDEAQAFVVTKVDHYLKVELLSSSKIFTEGLRVRKFLSSALFEIKEKWIPCIEYKLCWATRDVGGELAFRSLSADDGLAKQDSGIPSGFRFVWMPDSSLTPRAENSRREVHRILQPTQDLKFIDGMRTIGPVLDTMEQGGGLTLDQCDHIRNQLTPVERVRELVRRGEVDPYLLGAAVEMCSPEFVDLFSREKRGKDLVILHSEDFAAEFISPLQEAARKSGVPCHTETMASTDSVTVKTVQLLLNRNNRMVLLVISPKALEHWSNLDYEFAVRNKKLLLPILLDPQDGSRKWMDQVLQKRSPVLSNMEHEEPQMKGGAVAEEKLQEIVNNAVFGGIFSPLDEAGFSSLLKVWSARTGESQESKGIDKPQDLMRAMAKTRYITPGDLVKLEKDMVAAGISFPVIVRDIPIPDDSPDKRAAEASVGPDGGKVEIPDDFAKLTVPHSVLHEDTIITVSTVDIPSILRGPGGVSWTSGYPWSLQENACPRARELLEQVLFSPAVHVNLHGAQLRGPVKLETQRPPGSEGMECILLKHHDGEGWTNVKASSEPGKYSDTISIPLQTFSDVLPFWAPVETVKEIMWWVLNALKSRTLNCSFAAYVEKDVKPDRKKVQFHVVCRGKSVGSEMYRPGFTRCGDNNANISLYHNEKVDVVVSVIGGHEVSKQFPLQASICCGLYGQSVQMWLPKPEGEHIEGEVAVKTSRVGHVCEITFKEKEDTSTLAASLGGFGTAAQIGSSTDQGAAAPPRRSGGQDSPSMSQTSQQTVTSPRVGGTGGFINPQGHKPIVLLINDEYGTSKGGVSTINCGVGQMLAKAGAIVYATALRVPDRDQEAAKKDGVKLIGPDLRGKKTEPTLDWLTVYHSIHYPNLPQDVTCIIGHADITDTAARNIWEERYPQADLMTFTHVIPEDTDYYKGGRRPMEAWERETDMLDKVDNAKAAFSVGRRIFDHFDNQYRGGKEPKNHYIFLPKPSKIFLDAKVRPGGRQKSVLTVGRVRNAEKLKGHDLAAQSMREVVKEIKNARLRVRGISEDDWEKSKKILEDNLNSPDLNPTLLPYGTQEDIRDDMMTAHLVLMPSRTEPFGLVGLEAIAAGIPVLISDKSGLADMIKELVDKEKFSRGLLNRIVKTSVQDCDMGENARRWAQKICDTLNDTDTAFDDAKKFKDALLKSKYWEDSENKFLQACGITGSAAQAHGSE